MLAELFLLSMLIFSINQDTLYIKQPVKVSAYYIVDEKIVKINLDFPFSFFICRI